MSYKALVILSPGFEETEAITVIDILRRAKIDVVTSSLNGEKMVGGSHGISLMSDIVFSEIQAGDYSVIVLPGGLRGVENMLGSEMLLALVKDVYDRGGIAAAVCAAPLVLDRLHLLDGRRFTCHPCVHERLNSTGVLNDASVVDDRIVTGRSAGCAMVWSLSLVERLMGALPQTLLDGLRLP